ncbi:MAG TPA: hypothetical protein VG412_03705 [Acidimicrobiales bacterium]|nr:hypothetical protein [Acidimicrobiales bacterium]
MGKPGLDPKEFLERLKEDHQVLRWEPLPPNQPNPSSGGEQSRSGGSLDYLHKHWALPDSFHPEDAGGGPKGRLVSLFGRLTYRVLGRYFHEERELLGHVVRISEALERRCDALTLRVQEMNLEMVRRQVAEAENQAILAAWLHAESPRTTGGITSISSTLAQRNKAAAAALSAVAANEDPDRAR